MRSRKSLYAFASRRARLSIAAIILLSFAVALACAQTERPNAPPQAAPSPTPQQSSQQQTTAYPAPPLRRYNITPQSLPQARVQNEPAMRNPPRVVPRPAGAGFNLPPGFQINVYAEGGFQNPRMLALAPNGDVFLTDSQANTVIILRDTNGDGRADTRFTFARNLNQPFGLAFWRDYLYVGNTNSVVRFRYRPGQTEAQGEPERIADLPGQGYRQHWTRNVIFSPDGRKMYVSVGSESNVSVEAEPMRAAITEYNPDGTGKRIFATGLRNPIGMAFNPTTNRLWSTAQERDWLGDDLVPDYVTEIRDGGFYGWPYSYIGQNVDPRRQGEGADLVRRALVPDVLIQAHSAAMAMVFYQGRMFPPEYRGDAFVALRGSWNRTERTGYKIIRIPFRQGRPVGGYEDFITGWMSNAMERDVWGRPVGLLVLPDGSLLITDDGANMIYRVTYNAPRRPTTPRRGA